MVDSTEEVEPSHTGRVKNLHQHLGSNGLETTLDDRRFLNDLAVLPLLVNLYGLP